MKLGLHHPGSGAPADVLLRLDVTTDDGAQYAFVMTLAQWSQLLAGRGPIDARLADAAPEVK